MGKNAPKRAGFTLVEFLTVTAIVGTLAALLLPSLNSAREKSRAVACVNNLRQLGQAAMLYQDDYAALPAANNSGYFMWNVNEYVLFAQMLPIAGKSLGRSFYCPSSRAFSADDSLTGIQNIGVAGKIAVGSYYVRGHNEGAPRTLDGPVTALMADIFFSAGSARNHAGGVNVLFSDGASRFVPLPANWDIATTGAWDDLDRRGL